MTNNYIKAIDAIMDLHKPLPSLHDPENVIWCNQCTEGRWYAQYPCKTIQIIQKEITHNSEIDRN